MDICLDFNRVMELFYTGKKSFSTLFVDEFN